MTEQNIEIKEKLLNAAIEIIGKEGLHTITVRRLSEATGANVAAINYHFGSKENLMSEAVDYFFKKYISLMKGK